MPSRSFLVVVALVGAASAQFPSIKTNDGNIIASAIGGDVQFVTGNGETSSVQQIATSLEDIESNLKAQVANLTAQQKVMMDNAKKDKMELEMALDDAKKDKMELEMALAGNVSMLHEAIDGVRSDLDDLANWTNMTFMKHSEAIEENKDTIEMVREDAAANAIFIDDVNETVWEHEDQFLHAYSVLKALSGVEKETENDDLVAIHKGICHDRRRGYNISDGHCVDCFYDAAKRGCVSPGSTERSNLAFPKNQLELTPCSQGKWTYKVNEMKVNVVKTGLHRIYIQVPVRFTCSYYATTYGYLNIDGSRIPGSYCFYNRDYSSNLDTVMTLICDNVVELSAGEHTIDYQHYSYNSVVLFSDGYQAAHQYVQPLGTPAPAAASDTKECIANTGSTLLATAGSSGGYGYYYNFNLDIRNWFSEKNWVVTSQTGYIRVSVSFRFYTRLYANYGTEDLRLALEVTNQGTINCDRRRHNKQYGSYYSSNYVNDRVACDAVIKVNPGQQISVRPRAYHSGYYIAIYFESSSASAIIEDVPAPSLNQPDTFPSGCKGSTQRKIYVLKTLDSSVSFSNSKTTIVPESKINIKTAGSTIKVHLNANFMLQQSGRGNLGFIKIYPKINGNELAYCAWMQRKVYNSYTVSYNLVCDVEFVALKGENKIEILAQGRGTASMRRNSEVRNAFWIEEFPAPTLSTKI